LLKTRKKNSRVPVMLYYWPKSLPTYLPLFNTTFRYLGGLLSVVGTQYPATFGNVNFYHLLVPGC